MKNSWVARSSRNPPRVNRWTRQLASSDSVGQMACCRQVQSRRRRVLATPRIRKTWPYLRLSIRFPEKFSYTHESVPTCPLSTLPQHSSPPHLPSILSPPLSGLPPQSVCGTKPSTQTNPLHLSTLLTLPQSSHHRLPPHLSCSPHRPSPPATSISAPRHFSWQRTMTRPLAAVPYASRTNPGLRVGAGA